jgi:Zn-dependent protease
LHHGKEEARFVFNFSPEIIQNFILTYPVFLLSLSFHEMAHAITAKWGGDLTAAYQGRVSMNPLVHIDPIGTVLMPFLMTVTTGLPLIGWAKPVPVVSTNYRRGSSYDVVVSFAGPFSNIVLAIGAAILVQVNIITTVILQNQGIILPEKISGFINNTLWYMMLLNIILAVFNMIPIPPLDGSHILWHWFIKSRPGLRDLYEQFSRFGFIALILILQTGVASAVFSLIIMPIMVVLMLIGSFPNIFLL